MTQQKIFVQTFLLAWKGLAEKLEEGLAFLGKPPAPLLLALAHLASSTPANIINTVQAEFLRWLLPAISVLISSPLADGEALQGTLGVLCEALNDPKGTQ